MSALHPSSFAAAAAASFIDMEVADLIERSWSRMPL